MDDHVPARTVLLAGATGLVGRQVLALLLDDPRVKRVVAPTRRPLPPHRKLLDVQLDYEQPPEDASWWAVDAVVEDARMAAETCIPTAISPTSRATASR